MQKPQAQLFPASIVTTDKTRISNSIEPDALCFTLSEQFYVNILTSRKAIVLSSESDNVPLTYIKFRSILIVIITSTTLAGLELQRRACQRKMQEMFAFLYDSIIQGPVLVKAPFSRCFLKVRLNLNTQQTFISVRPFLVIDYNSDLYSKSFWCVCYDNSHQLEISCSTLSLFPWSLSAFQTSLKSSFQYASEVREMFFLSTPKAQSNLF